MGNAWSTFRGYNKQAQTSGLSPSSTEESNSKGPATDVAVSDDRKTSISNQEDKPPEEPQSNDTSYGVEATAVRTLAASTGTVAILGTTAQSQSTKDLRKEAESPEHSQPPDDANNVTKTDDKTGVPDATKSKEETEPAKTELESVGPLEPSETKENDINAEAPTQKSVIVGEILKNADVKDPTLDGVEKDKDDTKDVPKSPIEDQIKTDNAMSPNDLNKNESMKAGESPQTEVKEEAKSPILENSQALNIEVADEKKDAEVPTENKVTTPETAQQTPVNENHEESLTKEDSVTESSSQMSEPSVEKVPEENVPKEENHIAESKEEDVQKQAITADEAKSSKKVEEILSPGQDDNSEISLSAENDVSLPSPDGNTRSNEDEDNDISSEQLKTNSLSDISMSENAQSELEEKSEGLVAVESELKMISPMIEVNSPSEASDKNTSGEKTPEMDKIPDLKKDNENTDDTGETEQSQDINAAATTIQSGIRGFLARKQLKSSQNSSTDDLNKKLTDSMIDEIKYEVNEICKEAEKTTESIISTPDIDNDAIIPNEEFPAPPEDMLTDKVEDTQDEETPTMLNSQPTVPSSASLKMEDAKEQKADSAKQNDLNAVPLPPVDLDDNSAADSEQLPNDEDLPAPDFEMLESSYTDDINTEIINDSDKIVNAEDDLKDSTEGDLTIDEDSDKLLKELQKPQECDELREIANQIVDHTQKEIDNAASKIQAGVRGFLTRKQQNAKQTQPEIDTSAPTKIETEKTKNDITDEASEKEIEEAATKIQANFRGYKARKEGKSNKEAEQSEDKEVDTSNVEVKKDEPEKEPKPKALETVEDTSKEEQNGKKDAAVGNLVDVEDLVEKKNGVNLVADDLMNNSAVKIQAGVRGYLVRKKQQAEKEAATKIQASFKGFKARQQIKDQN